MIVKNESKIISRLLNSVLPVVDALCICDTGSTDNTKELIAEFAEEHKLPCVVVEEPFKNFEYNRSFALKQCYERRDELGAPDFILLLDADMILEVGTFKKESLVDIDLATLMQGNDNFFYKNTRLVRNTDQCKYLGVTHEYVSYPSEFRQKNIGRAELFIRDVGDGGAKDDKFERDIRLLLGGIEEDPKNERYHFYLANSYHDTRQHEKAIEYYHKRIELGGWREEVWYSWFRIGLCHKHLGNKEKALYAWLQCYNVIPHRLENFHEILNYYINEREYHLCKFFYDKAIELLAEHSKLGVHVEDFLFLHNDVYTYLLTYQYTIFAAYLGIKHINKEAVAVLNTCKIPHISNNVMSNLKFYKYKMPHTVIADFSTDYNDGAVDYRSSSMSIVPGPNRGFECIQRFVNYKINPQGGYENLDGTALTKVITQNKYLQLDKDCKIVKEQFLPARVSSEYISGLEDVRLRKCKNGTYKLFGTEMRAGGKIAITYGTYSPANNTYNLAPIDPDFSTRGCEKNWVFLSDDDIIYEWCPLTICTVSGDKLVKKKQVSTPEIFRHARGSSSVSFYNNEYWFLVHFVSYESPRHYYHSLVVLDEKYKPIRMSPLFVFEGQPIEYSIGMSVSWRGVLVAYSTWDNTTKMVLYNKKEIEEVMIHL